MFDDEDPVVKAISNYTLPGRNDLFIVAASEYDEEVEDYEEKYDNLIENLVGSIITVNRDIAIYDVSEFGIIQMSESERQLFIKISYDIEDSIYTTDKALARIPKKDFIKNHIRTVIILYLQFIPDEENRYGYSCCASLAGMRFPHNDNNIRTKRKKK